MSEKLSVFGKNPFIRINEKTGMEYVGDECSLNRAVMAKVPIKGIEDNIEGRMFKDIFSTALIVEEIEKTAKKYGIDISDYPKSHIPRFLDAALLSNDVIKKQAASDVTGKFGRRLGLIFLALKTGSIENRAARREWSDAHWEYWRNLERVILVGGLASGITGRHFKEHVFYMFDRMNVTPYEIDLFENATYVGVQGAAIHLMEDDSTSVVFDFGHTNLKRCIVTKRNGRIVALNPLESIPTPYMNSHYTDENEKFSDAVKLHKFLINTVISAYRYASRNNELSGGIIISIANYNSGGVLNSNHGGYAKLSLLSDDYEKLLSEEISSELHTVVYVKLVHDGTANALYFSDLKNCVCISIGTGFGIGFPDIHL